VDPDRDIVSVPISLEQFAAEAWGAGMPPNHVALLIGLFADVLDGRNAYVKDNVARLGREPKDSVDFSRETAAAGIRTAALAA
jgi:hypothetical protein